MTERNTQTPINPQNPIIIKPNIDFNSAQRLTNFLLNGRNYIPWARATRTALKGKDLLGHITGSKVRPKEETNEQEEWDIIDSQVVTLISNSLELQLTETFYCETTAELWKEIEGQFGNQKNHSQIYQLQREIAQISQENREISEIIGLIKAKYEELKTYRPHTTDLNVIREREETDRVYTFLVALDPSYEAIRAQILLSTEKLSFDEVTSRI
jgi:gag-polypeptide of LTR copia-type